MLLIAQFTTADFPHLKKILQDQQKSERLILLKFKCHIKNVTLSWQLKTKTKQNTTGGENQSP